PIGVPGPTAVSRSFFSWLSMAAPAPLGDNPDTTDARQRRRAAEARCSAARNATVVPQGGTFSLPGRNGSETFWTLDPSRARGAAMATVIPVDEFISDEWYPGFKPGYTHAPWYIDPVQTFRKEDEENFWFLDFHWPRGLTPMGLIWNEDGYNWSSQLAAEQMPLPPGRGITCRLGGTHT